jgi:hypothetical protein
MKYRKEIITTAGTLACAIGIGFFMQNAQSAPPASYQGAKLANADAAVLDVEEIILTSAEFFAPVTDDSAPAVSDDAPKGDLILHDNPIQPPGGEIVLAAVQDIVAPTPLDTLVPEKTETCAITSKARPVAAAMVKLTLSAPCLPGERVTVHHSGLLFNETTDAMGAFDIIIPAMTKEAVFIVAFTNGEGAVAQTAVEELADFDRVALQWKGNTGFGLHAREFGADYGTDGHVWSGAARDMTYAVTGQGGFMMQLGDPNVPDGLLAEVYTFPASSSQIDGAVDLSVETEVETNNCGLEIEARTLQTTRGNDITLRDLTLSVPDCDAAGNFLVLNNLLEDLTVASR